LEHQAEIASIVMAAGRGSRMKGFNGNKTLLPLIPGKNPYEGQRPALLHILHTLPPGPKAVVVHYRKSEVIEATQGLDLTYCEQPVLNGTGGALLSAREFIKRNRCEQFIITMGDVPLIRRNTYEELAGSLGDKSMVVLGFLPNDRKQYGVLDVKDDSVKRIIEWKYWSQLSKEKQAHLRICNSGIYTAERDALLHYLDVLEKHPHRVKKELGSKWTVMEEFFITDLVEYMVKDGGSVGHVLAANETEVMGVDDLAALLKAQQLFQTEYL
jgi:bifunctional UDP-N-acetylglucosamine pyrophosphorylase/glucosamine-1-phosphate N-acetyltransferase